MVTNVIAIYPGRFQPFGKHHAEAFKWLQKKFGAANCFIATSDKVELPKSPFNFKEKHDIISHYGFGDRVVKTKNPYKAEEIVNNLDPAKTSIVFMVGAKDMQEDPRFSMKPKKDGSESYYQDFEKNRTNLQGFDKHGYLVVAPHVSINIPGYGEMSGTNLRKALGSDKPRSQKIEAFKSIFGWYDPKLANMIFDKLEGKSQSKIAEILRKKSKVQQVMEEASLFSKDWWNDIISEVETKPASKNDRILDFIHYAAKRLKLKKLPNIKSTSNIKYARNSKSYGHFDPSTNTILVYTGHRAMPDILRTIAHELVHRKQDELGLLKADSGKTGSKHENQANSISGILLRTFGKNNPEIFAEGYMSAKVQAKHNAKIDKLKTFLHNNVGREFVYNFNEFPKTVYGVPVEDLQESKILKEGGAGGHMAHPFDIPTVKTGQDLLNVFQKSIEYLQKGPASVKIDGVNASIRLITLDGKKTFVMDRGSGKELDVRGVTKADLEARFGAGHGMIKVGGEVLDIFNNAIPTTKPALIKLGLWDNPNILFNIEYVSGKTNVQEYGKNFLAIHGLLEISQVTPTKRATKEIKYNKTAMNQLINGLAPIADKAGFEVLGSIPTTLDKEPNLKKVLQQKYTVNYGDHEETKTLAAWLKQTTMPVGDIKLKSGKRVSALSKDVLVNILNGNKLSDYVADENDYQKAINGFVMYLATMKLGDAILESLSSPLGPVSNHEGIVIRDKSIYTKPFKITGKFILGGLASSFRK
jgi:hypothetical protein